MKTPSSDTFLANYVRLVLASARNDFSDNHDICRFGPEAPAARKNENLVLATARRFLLGLGLTTSGAANMQAGQSREEIVGALKSYLPNLSEIEWLYSVLSDEESRKTLVDILAYRAMGYRKIKLPLNTPEYWEQFRSIEKAVKNNESFDLGFMGFRAYKADLAPFGYPIEIFYTPRGIQTQFLLEQYRCKTDSGTIETTPGDVVLDCGGCYGDTALYFAHKAGEAGRVYSFEFVPDNLKNWRRNIDMNPTLKPRIQLVQAPVWSESGMPLYIEGIGPGTQVLSEPKSPGAMEVKTTSIDDMVEEQKLDTVNFIKMDIEGAELAALHGAEKTIRRFKPKLAITVYHSLEDFWAIPSFLNSLDLGYSFYLRHFTTHSEETVLFCVSK